MQTKKADEEDIYLRTGESETVFRWSGRYFNRSWVFQRLCCRHQQIDEHVRYDNHMWLVSLREVSQVRSLNKHEGEYFNRNRILSPSALSLLSATSASLPTNSGQDLTSSDILLVVEHDNKSRPYLHISLYILLSPIYQQHVLFVRCFDKHGERIEIVLDDWLTSTLSLKPSLWESSRNRTFSFSHTRRCRGKATSLLSDAI